MIIMKRPISTIGKQKDWRFYIPRERDFSAVNFDILPRVGKLSYDCEIFGTSSLF